LPISSRLILNFFGVLATSSSIFCELAKESASEIFLDSNLDVAGVLFPVFRLLITGVGVDETVGVIGVGVGVSVVVIVLIGWVSVISVF